MSRRPRPPMQRCPGCGGQHYAFGERTPCDRCKAATAPDAAALRGAVHAARVDRLGYDPADQRFVQDAPTDDIPY